MYILLLYIDGKARPPPAATTTIVTTTTTTTRKPTTKITTTTTELNPPAPLLKCFGSKFDPITCSKTRDRCYEVTDCTSIAFTSAANKHSILKRWAVCLQVYDGHGNVKRGCTKQTSRRCPSSGRCHAKSGSRGTFKYVWSCCCHENLCNDKNDQPPRHKATTTTTTPPVQKQCWKKDKQHSSPVKTNCFENTMLCAHVRMKHMHKICMHQ